MNRIVVGSAAALGLAASLAACASKPKPAPRPVASVPVQPVCADFSFPVYFDTNSGQLTGPAQQVVQDAAARVRGCTVTQIEVLGLADSVGSASANLAVSRRRATAVADALARAGLPRPVFSIEAAGANGALTPEGRPEPLRRRAEVVIRASAPAAR